MRQSFIASMIPAVVTTLVAGCGTTSKQAASSPAAAVPSEASTTAAPRTEVATGDVREALLLLQRVHFAVDSNLLLPESQTALADAAGKLKAHADVHLHIEGHADERGTTEHNIALGDKRATTVKDYLARMGISPERLHINSFGSERPLAKGHDPSSYAQNRRADFRLMRGSVRLVLEQGTLVDDQGRPMAPGSPQK